MDTDINIDAGPELQALWNVLVQSGRLPDEHSRIVFTLDKDHALRTMRSKWGGFRRKTMDKFKTFQLQRSTDYNGRTWLQLRSIPDKTVKSMGDWVLDGLVA